MSPGSRLRRIPLAAALLMPLAAAALAAALLAAPARAAEPDYSGWQDLLRRYLKVLSEKGRPWDSRFDYEQLYIDEGIWTKHRADGLATLHTQLLSVSPAEMTPGERTAWAINAYNFLVIEQMTLNLLVPGRKFTRYDSPKQVHRDVGSFFGAPVVKIDGTDYSLTGFERRYVYGDTTGDPSGEAILAREKPGDARLSYALCKGSLCTGLLLPWVYRSDSLQAQLDRATRMALALPRFVQANATTGELAATNRFFEERADYGGTELSGVLPFLRKYGTPATQRLIATRKLTRVSRYFEPDWKLNQFDHPPPKLPNATEGTPPKSH